VVTGRAQLAGKYRVIYADSPWRYRNTSGTKGNSAVKEHYPDMSIEELCKLPVEAHAEKHAVLFMWVTVPMLYENPGPREVLEAWGFRYQSMQTWDKVLGNPGRFLHITTEHLIIGERGNCPPDSGDVPKSLFTDRRTGHSVKPAVTRKMIEKMFTTGPYLELFGRELVKGWHVFGNDPKLWSGQQEGG
jgi:N6-adenosine-specific RNA methylase IME4